jgi:hypothetical protein
VSHLDRHESPEKSDVIHEEDEDDGAAKTGRCRV